MMARAEIKLPHVLTHAVTPLSTSRSKGHVIIDDSVVHQTACVFIEVASVAGRPWRRFEPRGLFHGRFAADEVINWHSLEGSAGIGDLSLLIAAFGINCRLPSRPSVINEVRDA